MKVVHRYLMKSHYLFRRGETMWWQYTESTEMTAIWFKIPHWRFEGTAKARTERRRGHFTLIYLGPSLILTLQLTQTRAGHDPTSIQLMQSNRGARPVSPPEPAVHSRGAGMSESDMNVTYVKWKMMRRTHTVHLNPCCYFILLKTKSEFNSHIMIVYSHHDC